MRPASIVQVALMVRRDCLQWLLWSHLLADWWLTAAEQVPLHAATL